MSLSDLFIEQERKLPERICISGEFGQVSYAEMLARVRRLGRMLPGVSSSIGNGRPLGISTASTEFVAYAIWAAMFTDISIVFLPACRNVEVMQRTMQEAAIETLVTDEPTLLQESWCLDSGKLLRRVLAADAQAEARTVPHELPARESEAGFVFQTSGTCGEPKWVQCEYRKFATVIDCMLMNGTLEHAREQSVFLTPPLYHSYGLSTFLEYILAGSTVIFPQRTSPLGPVGELRDSAMRADITAIEAVPYFYSQLSKLADRFRMPALTHLGLGGGALDINAFEKLREVYPAATVSVRYGLTETPSVVSHKLFHPSRQEDWKSSGPVLPAYHVEIVDAAGRALDKNQEGEIAVSGEPVATRPGQDERCLLTGDTGYLTDAGELVITGRKSLYIKNRGFRLSPEQVESVITSFAGVHDCRVLQLEARLIAEVVYDETVSQADILAFISTRLPEYAIPDQLTRVERVPRTPSGKIRRQAVTPGVNAAVTEV